MTYIRGGYFTNWAHYRPSPAKYEPEAYQAGLCTHIFFAFGNVNSDATVGPHDEQDLPSGPNGGYYARVNKLKQLQPGLKTLISFGGWQRCIAEFKNAVSTPAKRATFIKSASSFAKQYGFDGVDIDWEYPEASDKANFAALFSEFRAAVGNDFLLTAAVPANKNKVNEGYDVVSLARSVSFINVMTYDFHGSWENRTGMNSPLYSAPGDITHFNTASAMSYWVSQGMPSAKLVLGIASYGCGWTLSDPSNHGVGAPGGAAPKQQYTGAEGIMAYYEIEALGGTRYWDSTRMVPYVVKDSLWYSYDDVQSIGIKMNWLKAHNFGGAFVWTLDFDDFANICSTTTTKYPLINAIKTGLEGGSPVTVPTSNPLTAASTGSGDPLTSAIKTGFEDGNPRPQPPPATVPTCNPHPAPIGLGCGASTEGPGQSFTCPFPDGFFADPYDRKMFYRCVNGVPYHFACAPGTEWNDEMKTCDWPKK